jgi:hypothetical protein
MKYLKSSFVVSSGTGTREVVGPSERRIALIFSGATAGVYQFAPTPFIGSGGILMPTNGAAVFLHKSMIGETICGPWSANSFAVSLGVVVVDVIEDDFQPEGL